MKYGWIIYDEKGACLNKSYIQMYFDEGEKMNIQFRLILGHLLEFGTGENGLFVTYQGEQISLPDFAIVRMIHPLLSKQLEYMSVPTYNNATVAQICNDKSRTYQYVSSHGIVTVPTIFCENYQLATYLNNENIVIKSVQGHGGQQVFRIPEDQALVIDGIGKNDFCVQPFVKGPGKDVRVYIIGTKIVAAVCRTSQDGFKSNYSLGGQVELYTLSENEIAIVKKIISLFKFGLVGIDFIIKEDGSFLFNEIEDVVGARMLYQCSDINLVAKYLKFICRNEFANDSML